MLTVYSTVDCGSSRIFRYRDNNDADFFLVCIYTQTIDGYVELEIKHSTAHIPKFRRPAHVYHHWPDRVSCQCCLLPLIIYIVILCRDMSIV